ncbi:MAG: erythromycin esterase family protein [Flavobacteriales bacterium]|nr:erythromycin esterase family protein [Flavobacteriales bacterium]
MSNLRNRYPILLSISLLWAYCCSAQTRIIPPTAWLQEQAIPLNNRDPGVSRLATLLSASRVIGLGEATHGQHESFDLKRRATMELVRHHGCRTVAYEASASKARACNDYIQGRTDDRAAAMRGFGMLIWAVEENAALLDDLRAWNAAAAPADRVRFIGFDAQDGEAVVERIGGLIRDTAMTGRLNALLERAGGAMQQLFQGDRRAFEALGSDLDRLERDFGTVKLPHQDEQAELLLRATELRAHILMYATPGGRDKAMADLLLAQLGTDEKCVVWAHNGHVKRSALDYLGTEELAMGGHLANALHMDYYALGFAFGYGDFQANAPDSTGRWGFKRYHHTALASGSLEADLAATGLGDLAVDLRSAPPDTTVQRWLTTPHGQRWWGGYNVPDDCDERTRDASQLMPMTPANDFDGLVFFARTTAAVPVDRSRIIPSHRD